MNALRPWSRDDLLTVTEAAERIGGRRQDAVAWLRARRLVRTVGDREVVIWGDVLDEIRASAFASPSVAVGSRVPRAVVPARRGVKS